MNQGQGEGVGQDTNVQAAGGVAASIHSPWGGPQASHANTGPPGTPHPQQAQEPQNIQDLVALIQDAVHAQTQDLHEALGTANARINALQTDMDHLRAQLDQNFNTEAFDDALKTNNVIKDIYSKIGMASNAPAPPTHSQSLVARPEEFHGDRSKFTSWQSQLHTFIALNSSRFASDQDRVLYAISTIRGEAYPYVQAIADSIRGTPSLELLNFQAFMHFMERTFGPIDPVGDAQRALKGVKQAEGQMVEAYAAEFRRWSGLTQWDSRVLMDMFRDGLQRHVRVLLIHEPQVYTLEDFMRQAATIESKWRTAAQDPSTTPAAPPTNNAQSASAPVASDPNAMDIGRMRLDEAKKKLSPTERERREKEGACMKCGKGKHRAWECRGRFSATKPSTWKPRVASMPALPNAPTSPTLTSDSVDKLVEALNAMKVQRNSPAPTSAPSEGAPGPSSGF